MENKKIVKITNKNFFLRQHVATRTELLYEDLRQHLCEVSEQINQDAVLYTPQQRSQAQKAVARMNIGAVSVEEVLQIIVEQFPELAELLGLEYTENKQNDLTHDGTGTKYPTVDAVNNKFKDIETITHYFSFEKTVEVFHGLGVYVDVFVILGTEKVLANVEYTPDMNAIRILFSKEETGIVVIKP